MDVSCDLHSFMIVLAFAFVFGCGITGYFVGTVDRQRPPSSDFEQGLIWIGFIVAAIAVVADGIGLYNQCPFELSALCWLFVSGGFLSLCLGVGLALGPVKRR